METDHGRMIGQEFFDLRSRLSAALSALAALAQEAGADQDHSVILDNLINNLKDPFVFVVAGEVNVGKSTFLNALFAADVTKTGVVPTTDKIYFFKYGPALKHVPITRTLEEVFVPIDFLRDFHIVDTPGTNSIANEHQEITERFVPMADLVIFVFSAMNPWGASAWQFLEKVHQHWMRHVVFVLQQCDLRTEEEIAAILDYMKQLCRQRFDREFPIFPVSAKKAYLARSSGLDRDRLINESGFPPLESHISRSIGGSGRRLGKLSTALRTATDVLAHIQSSSAARVAAREEKTRVLQEIEKEMLEVEQRTYSKLLIAIEATDSDFERESDTILARARARFSTVSALRSVFKEKRTVAGLERSLLDQVSATSTNRWLKTSVIVEDDVNTAADYLSERITEDLKVQLREDLRPDAPFWEAQRRRFVGRVEEMLQRCVHKIEVEPTLQPALKATRWRAACFLLVVLGCGAAAGVFAGQEQWILAGVVASSGFLLGAMFWFFVSHVLGRSRQALAGRMSDARPELRAHLDRQLRDEVHNLYDNLTRILQPTREKLAEQGQRHAALQMSLEDIGAEFRVLDRELASMVEGVKR